MQTTGAQAIFALRKLIERIHAHYKNRGLGRLTVRGLMKNPSDGALECACQQSHGGRWQTRQNPRTLAVVGANSVVFG